ncbi:MAG: hypothetical protein QOG67_1298 [Verrucomicrobiota bacterium]|jgi:hypothetical protein
MPEQWIVRVAGINYGPAEISTLQEWKNEGRVLAVNEARRVDLDDWVTAATIPGLFEAPPPPVQVGVTAIKPQRSLTAILLLTARIYIHGFFSYLGLTLLIIGPSLCAQLTTTLIESTPNVDADLRKLAEVGFGLCMLLLWLAMRPIYVAGIQILTAELAAGRRIGFLKILNAAIKFWPRVALLCLFVCLSYAFWTVLLLLFASGLLFSSLSSPNLASIFVSLVLITLWIWIIGRLWVSFLFWQQFAVLGGCDIWESISRSKQLARLRDGLPRFQRPLWRGIFVTSLWFALVAAMNWMLLPPFFQTVTTPGDPQVLMRTFWVAAESLSTNRWVIAFEFAQRILQPLLGIAFVLIYLDATKPALPQSDTDTYSAGEDR